MKIKLLRDGLPDVECSVPYPGAKYVLALEKCECGEEFKVQGGSTSITNDDSAYEAPATCVYCGRRVGILRVETDTLFGISEDERVLCGRWRVY